MGRPVLLTIVQKIALGYLLTACFGLLATIYALNSLGSQTHHTSRLINGDYAALMQVTSLRQDLLALARLNQAEEIFADDSLVTLHEQRRTAYLEQWQQLLQLPLSQPLPPELLAVGTDYASLLADDPLSGPTKPAVDDQVTGLHSELLKQLDLFMSHREKIIDNALASLTEQSNRAFRDTLMLALVGASLGIAVALSVILAIYRSTRSLIQATRRLAGGDYDYQIDTERTDEFGELARAFVSMGNQLQQLEQLRLDANPLTHLPGNLAIDLEIEKRLNREEDFAHVYIDLDNFKAYNDRYGYQAGDDAIALVSDILKGVLERDGAPDDLLGHIGGDDYVVLTSAEKAESLAQATIREFDQRAPQLYSEKDRQTGFIVGRDRSEQEVRYPLMTISIAIVTANSLGRPSPAAISRECAKIKKHLKKLPGSNYLIDRREQR